jgi:predicted membrane protein
MVNLAEQFAQHADILMRFAINVAAMSLHIFGMYYRRYRNKEVVTAAALFNIFIFSVLTMLSSVDFSVTAGFGLFAILALFTLRSEPLEKVEMTYFFGSVAIAVICAVNGGTILLPLLIVTFLLIGVYVIDHPKMLKSVRTMRLQLDQIDADLLSDPTAVNQRLAKRLNVEVMSYEVLQLDYINEMARINVYCRIK